MELEASILHEIATDVTSAILRNAAAPLVGRGGSSDIYRAELNIGDQVAPVEVAIKVMRVGVRDVNGENEPPRKAIRRLLRELSVLEGMDHPGVNKLFGYSHDFGELPAIVSLWCPHGDAKTYLRDNPDADRKKMLLEVTAAVEYLHTLQPPVIHGDIKATNIFIKENGTPRWMAHELLFNESADPRAATKASDMWALGCLALEISTGEIPWQAIQCIPRVIALVYCGFTPPRPTGEIAARLLDDDLWHLIETCWHHDPDQRPDISTFRKDLCHVLKTECPYASSPPSRRPLSLVPYAGLIIALLLYVLYV
ncbi:hypothetical protein BOTBODRAFT_450643 [Botryobasidium botryosum FD-172 SS1]|uniref:Protein kinase domain-containing protein n=1 Tax=Botryobasidium botryosum (strain FD-172 SS1) TaxID=930990 RepID=A0A067MIL9_BOTB1|nr:hypothetical protein BOTBODRAFT_450643 [Botryobasidium botryosum FD-172 SS1]